MQIFVKTIEENTVILAVESTDKIGDLKAKIRNRERINEHRLVFVGKQLEDGMTLADYDIQNGSTLHQVQIICNGAPYYYEMHQVKTLAIRQNVVKMICRKCFGRLAPTATNCRRKKCGGSSKLRRRSLVHSRNHEEKNIKEWSKRQMQGYGIRC